MPIAPAQAELVTATSAPLTVDFAQGSSSATLTFSDFAFGVNNGFHIYALTFDLSVTDTGANPLTQVSFPYRPGSPIEMDQSVSNRSGF